MQKYKMAETFWKILKNMDIIDRKFENYYNFKENLRKCFKIYNKTFYKN